MQSIPVFIVSLKEATERRVILREHLQGLEIDFEFIEATRGSALDHAYRKVINPAANMSPQALGCYLSHINIYERILRENIPVALILEDDTVLHYSVKTLLDWGCQTLNFDYCFLLTEDHGDEGYVFYNTENSVDLTSEHKGYQLSTGPYCLNAYLITLQGAKNRMSCAFPARAPIDHYHYLPFRPRFFAIFPTLAYMNEQSAVDSMTSMNWSGLQKIARKYWWYYPLRDVVKFRALKKLLAMWQVKLPNHGRWRSFESGVKVVPPKRYAKG